MSKNIKVTKEDIIQVSYTIVKKEGMDQLSVRKIAQQLNCSVQPIYYQFGNLEELKKTIWEKIVATYQNYMKRNLDKESPYKQMGINYINFAKEEPKLFQMLFMSKTDLTPESFLIHDESFPDIEKYASVATGLKSENLRKYHLRMWTFTHGIACLVAMKTCNFEQEEIKTLLTDEYQALNLLEQERKKKNEQNN